MSSIDLTVRVRDERKPHPASVRRLLDLARQWDRWADDYDAQARRAKIIQLRLDRAAKGAQ